MISSGAMGSTGPGGSSTLRPATVASHKAALESLLENMQTSDGTTGEMEVPQVNGERGGGEGVENVGRCSHVEQSPLRIMNGSKFQRPFN